MVLDGEKIGLGRGVVTEATEIVDVLECTLVEACSSFLKNYSSITFFLGFEWLVRLGKICVP